ncbi:hypothetical protein KGY73_10905 [bacterium]|nr:hypothetical protein [bacterium]
MKKRRIYSLIFVGLVVLAGILVLSVAFPRRVSITHNAQSERPVGEIHGEKTVGQTFVAEYNHLTSVEVFLATYERKNKGNFFFHLRNDVGSEEDIFKHKGKMQKVKNNRFFRFDFPEIPRSKGKRYYFFIEAPKASSGNAITLGSSPQDVYKDGEKIVNGAAAPGDLVFKTEYELGWRLSGAALGRRLGMILTFFGGLFQNKVFYIVLLLGGFLWGFVTFVQRKRLFQRKGGFLAVFGILLFLILGWITLLFSKKIVVYNQFQNTTSVGEIQGERKVGQTFVASYDNLKAVELLMANYGRELTGEIIFHLKKSIPASDDVVVKKVDAARVKDNRYFRYQFPEIQDSGGKKYYFYLEAPEAKPGNAATIWCNEEDKYFEGEKFVNGKAAEGDLTFKTVYDVGIPKKVSLFLGEITRAKPFPLSERWFYWGLVGLFLVSCSLFLTYLFKVFVDRE